MRPGACLCWRDDRTEEPGGNRSSTVDLATTTASVEVERQPVSASTPTNESRWFCAFQIAMEDRRPRPTPQQSIETNCCRKSRFRMGSMRLQGGGGMTTRRRLTAVTPISFIANVLCILLLASKSSYRIVHAFISVPTDRSCRSSVSRRSSPLRSAVAPLRPIDERQLFLGTLDTVHSEHEASSSSSSGIGPVFETNSKLPPMDERRLFLDLLDSLYTCEHETKSSRIAEQEVVAETKLKGGDHHKVHQSIEAAATTTTIESSSARFILAEQRRRAMAAEVLRNRQLRTSAGPRQTTGGSVRSPAKRSTSERLLDVIRRSAVRPPAGVLDDAKAAAKVTRSVIRSAIEEIMENHSVSRANHMPDDSSSLSSFVGKSIGVLGDQQDLQALRDHRRDMSKLTIVETDSNVLIRLASSLDDVDIANLRLSVFADCSSHERSQFCARSCLAMAARRKRGASCLVATRPAATMGESPLVVGSAECSFHEFYGTQLGKRRKQHSILYVTEVAVSPSARRQGIGSNLLQAIDILAKKRLIETLYLHVDVSNEKAIQLYKKAGYSRVANAAMFQEFTRSLNLHPGATKGRDHFLFFKNLTPRPVWLDPVDMERQPRQRTDENQRLEVFGFEIPA